MTTTPTLFVTTGLPASGKTTWAVDFMMDYKIGEIVRISRNDIRRTMFHPGYRVPIADVETVVTTIQHAAIAQCLKSRVSVVCDDTNLESAHIVALSNLATEADCFFELVDFTAVPLETCVERDKLRDPDSRVGEVVLRSMSDRLHRRLASDKEA